MRIFLILALLGLSPSTSIAQDRPVEGPMTMERMVSILTTLDPAAAPVPAGIGMTIDDIPVLVVADPAANRMRAMVPVASASGLTAGDLMRVLQANFDSALDARYAVANGRLWSIFIHPLRELERAQLVSGLVQTVVLARTYGATYSSGATIFGRGDSAGLHRELLRELLERGEDL